MAFIDEDELIDCLRYNSALHDNSSAHLSAQIVPPPRRRAPADSLPLELVLKGRPKDAEDWEWLEQDEKRPLLRHLFTCRGDLRTGTTTIGTSSSTGTSSAIASLNERVQARLMAKLADFEQRNVRRSGAGGAIIKTAATTNSTSPYEKISFVPRNIEASTSQEDPGTLAAAAGSPADVHESSMTSRLLAETVVQDDHCSYVEYAKFEAIPNAPNSKRFAIVFPYANCVLPIHIARSARVADLIGLACHIYTRQQREPPCEQPVQYDLFLAEEDSMEWDTELPPQDRRRLVANCGFPALAMVARDDPLRWGRGSSTKRSGRRRGSSSASSLLMGSSSKCQANIFLTDGRCYAMQLDTLDVSLRHLFDYAMECKKLDDQSVYQQNADHFLDTDYVLETYDKPGHALDLANSVADVGTRDFVLLRLNSARGVLLSLPATSVAARRQPFVGTNGTAGGGADVLLQQQASPLLCQSRSMINFASGYHQQHNGGSAVATVLTTTKRSLQTELALNNNKWTAAAADGDGTIMSHPFRHQEPLQQQQQQQQSKKKNKISGGGGDLLLLCHQQQNTAMLSAAENSNHQQQQFLALQLLLLAQCLQQQQQQCQERSSHDGGMVLEHYEVNRLHRFQPKTPSRLVLRTHCLELVPTAAQQCQENLDKKSATKLKRSFTKQIKRIPWELVAAAEVPPHSEQRSARRTVRIIWLCCALPAKLQKRITAFGTAAAAAASLSSASSSSSSIFALFEYCVWKTLLLETAGHQAWNIGVRITELLERHRPPSAVHVLYQHSSSASIKPALSVRRAFGTTTTSIAATISTRHQHRPAQASAYVHPPVVGRITTSSSSTAVGLDGAGNGGNTMPPPSSSSCSSLLLAPPTGAAAVGGVGISASFGTGVPSPCCSSSSSITWQHHNAAGAAADDNDNDLQQQPHQQRQHRKQQHQRWDNHRLSAMLLPLSRKLQSATLTANNKSAINNNGNERQ